MWPVANSFAVRTSKTRAPSDTSFWAFSPIFSSGEHPPSSPKTARPKPRVILNDLFFWTAAGPGLAVLCNRRYSRRIIPPCHIGRVIEIIRISFRPSHHKRTNPRYRCPTKNLPNRGSIFVGELYSRIRTSFVEKAVPFSSHS